MTQRTLLPALAALLAGALAALGQNGPPASMPAPDPTIAKLGGTNARVHDPSTVTQCGDEYWTFYTGRGIGSWYSTDLLHWQAGPHVFDTPPAWIAEAVPAHRGNDYWAPDVAKVGDKYLLFYACSVFGKNTSTIGVASNPTLNPADPAYKWTDGGMVITSTTRDDFNAIDPAIFQDSDHSLWLAFGSFWSGIRLIQLDPATGKRIAPDSPIHLLAHYSSIEASYIYKHDGHYYLFVDWGLCCRGVNSTYNIRVGRSDKVTGPYLDKEGKDMKTGGGTLVAATDGNFIGPGHAGIITKDGQEYMSMHFYDGTRRGASELAIRPVRWTADGWPVVGEAEKK